MFEGMSFDELNQMNAGKRSIDYEKYFGEMEITEQEKKRRISLAKKFEDEFLFILAYLFTLQQYQRQINWQEIQQRFEAGYLAAIKGSVDADEYIKSYARKFSYDVADSTKNHETNSYYYSIDRSIFMSENEANFAWEHQDYAEALKARKKRKQWISMRDKRVRHTHKEVDGKVIQIREPFLVGNSLLLCPGDTSLGADSSEIVSCRCTVKYF